MNGARSLQWRLGVGLAAGATVLWLAGMLTAGLVLRHELDEAYDSALQEAAQRLLALAVTELPAPDGEDASTRRIAPLAPHEEYITYRLRDAEGRVLLQSHDADPAHFSARPAIGFRTSGTHRIYGEAAPGGALYIEVAEPLAHRAEAATEATLALAWPLALLLPLALVAVWWYVRRSLRPLRALGAEIEGRGGGDLSLVRGGGLPSEIVPIAGAVNRLLERLARALEAERSFTANSAHELRTPIAAALARTQRLIATAEDPATRARAREIEDSLHRLGRLAEKLMQLARAEGAGLQAAGAQDLAPVLVHLVDEFRQDPTAAGRLRFAPPDELRSRLDADGFAVLMRNLIENALRHAPPGTPVEIAAADHRTVRVVNGGPALPPETLAGLTARFARGAGAGTGTGLGLAIAAAIAKGSGAVLDLHSPATGRDDGFEAVLRLPA
jgi:two-component system OmpR family sensor kinase